VVSSSAGKTPATAIVDQSIFSERQKTCGELIDRVLLCGREQCHRIELPERSVLSPDRRNIL
jgi:hypothetical protein